MRVELLEGARCLFCGGDASERDHLAHCDGRHGHVEAAFAPLWDRDDLPTLASGLVPATLATSEAAAASVEDHRATQRLEVLEVIRRAGPTGCTDDEIQCALGLDGSSERPRRWELWRLAHIRMRLDDQGAAVKRWTRTHRRAVVWIAV